MNRAGFGELPIYELSSLTCRANKATWTGTSLAELGSSGIGRLKVFLSGDAGAAGAWLLRYFLDNQIQLERRRLKSGCQASRMDFVLLSLDLITSLSIENCDSVCTSSESVPRFLHTADGAVIVESTSYKSIVPGAVAAVATRFLLTSVRNQAELGKTGTDRDPDCCFSLLQRSSMKITAGPCTAWIKRTSAS